MVKKYKPSKEELYDLYIVQGLSTREIGDKYGKSYTTISRWLKKFNIPIRSLSEAKLAKYGGIKPSKDDLYHDYWVENMSGNEIATKYKVSHNLIGECLVEYNIPKRTLSEAQLNKKGGIKPSNDELYNDYWIEGLSAVEIGVKYGVSDSAIGIWLKEYNIPIRNLSEACLIKRGGIKPSKEELYNDYWIEGLNAYEIAKKYKVSDCAIGIWLREYGIDIKPYYLGESYYLKSVKEYLESLPMYYETEKCIYKDKKRCDITLPFLKLGIEINDTRTHNLENNKYSKGNGKDFYYHQLKTKEAWENDWVLIHLWEKDIDNFKSILDKFIFDKDLNNLNPVFSEPNVFTDNRFSLADDGCIWN